MVEQVLPQWEINQIFQATATAAVRTLRALIMGPAYKVQRNTALTAYAGIDVATAWPGRSAGDVVDDAFTSVLFKDAAQRYATIAPASSVKVISGKTNRLKKSTAGVLNWIDNPTSPSGYPRSALLPVDVALGDWVRVTNGVHSKISQVVGFDGANVPAVVSAAVHSRSTPDQAGSTSATAGGSNTGDAVPTAHVSNPTTYHGETVRVLSETYTITVVASDEDGGQAVGTVTSASGTDPQYDMNLSLGLLNVGSRGARVTFAGVLGDAFRVGDVHTVTVVQAYTNPTLTKGGTYAGATDTTYVVTVTKGGILDAVAETDRPEISVTAIDASDAGVPRRVSTTTVPLGTKGVTGLFASGAAAKIVVYGDEWTVQVTAAKVGNYDELIIADTLAGAQFPTSAALQVELALVSDIVVPRNRANAAPLVNWVSSPTQLTLKAGITSTATRTGSLALVVQAATAQVTYRALQTAMAGQIYDIADEAAVQALLGADDVDAGLAYGVRRAISNAGGVTIKVLPVISDDLAGYAAAIAKLKERDDFYRIVPLTYDTLIQDAVISEVNRRSTATQGRWATVMVAKELHTELAVVAASKQGAQHFATITDPLGGADYRTVEDANGQFITWGVRAGDQLRARYTNDGFGNLAYSVLTVDTVVSEQILTVLESITIPVGTPALYEIWHPLSTVEQAADWGAACGALANRRVTCSFPANPGRGGVKVPGYFLSCSLAGLRSAAAPQQGLTNAEIQGWDDMSEAAITFADQLDALANYGAYIVTQNPSGQVYVRKQLTTDLSDTRKAEDSGTVNLDSISYFFLDLLAPFIGKSNVVPSALKLIEASINNGIQQLGTVTNASIGAQLGNGELQYIRPHAVLLDRVVARVTGDLPIPLNNGELDIVV